MRHGYLKNAALLTGADVMLRLAGMGLRIYLANALGGEGMGLYQLVLAVYSLFVTLATAGVSVAATRLMAEELGQNRAQARGMLVRLQGWAAWPWQASWLWRRSLHSGGWGMCGLRLHCGPPHLGCRGWRYPLCCGAFLWPGGR